MTRRALRAALTTLLLAIGLVIVPLPRLVWATEMSTETVHPKPMPVGESFVDPATVPRPDDDGDDIGGAVRSDDGDPGTRSAVIDHAAGSFDTIGIGWPGDVDPEAVIVRTGSTGSWSPWYHLSFSADHRPDDTGSAAVSEPLWVGDADAYEIQFPTALGEPSVHLVGETRTRIALEVDEPTAGADPSIGLRSSWGAREPSATPLSSATLEVAIVHHSVTPNDYGPADVPGILRSIQAFHMDARGWDDIAYNFVVDRFGRTWEGRAGGIDRPVIGGHAYGFNVGTTGVLVLGTYESTTPSSASLAGVSDLIAWKFALHHVPATGTVTLFPAIDTHHGPAGTPVVLDRITGHRNTGQTSCPGQRLYDRLGTIRFGTGPRLDTARQSAPPILVGGDRSGDGRDDALVYHPGTRAERDLSGRPGPTMSRSSTQVSGIYEPLEGDFDGDGISDVFWYRPGPAPDYVWYGRSGGGHQSVATNIYGDYVTAVGDFDGNGADDIVWHGPYGTPDHLFWGGPSGFTPSRLTIDDKALPIVGDFDGDGFDDIVWYGWGRRPDGVSWGRADRALGTADITIDEGFEPFTGDFDGDGADDILFQAPGPMPDYVWSVGAARTPGMRQDDTPGTADPIVGDFDGDGRDDVMWYVAGPGADQLWLNDAGGRRIENRPVNGTYETLVLDADGNGRDELLWVSDTNLTYLWSRSNAGTHQSTRIA